MKLECIGGFAYMRYELSNGDWLTVQLNLTDDGKCWEWGVGGVATYVPGKDDTAVLTARQPSGLTATFEDGLRAAYAEAERYAFEIGRLD